MHSRTTAVLLTALPMALFGFAMAAPQAQRDPAGAEFFEAKVRPLLLKHCVACHGANQQMGGLRLDTHEGLLKGGAQGKVVTPGKPAESPLLAALSYQHEKLKMPPAGKLPDAQIAILTRWVESGAPWSAKVAPAKATGGLWSLRPIRRPQPPKVHNAAWVNNPIDAFILQGLERRGMQPAPPAGKRELLRRLYFDLIGLPPTPDELRNFLQDNSPNAYEKAVDRLLASPHYGERWARHWLDLVRYADSNGYERDAEKPYSWKYRDYVIRSLNEDKPYNRFILEQLAGDELPDRNETTVIATGFLRLGTWDDEPNDPLEYKFERLEDLVHVTSAAFLGLTLRCARCHDHKFDPLPQKDYYAIASAFYGGYLDPGDGKLMGGPPEAKLGVPALGFTDKGREAPPLKLLVGGDARREGVVVEPGYLSALPQCRREVAPPAPNARTTGRRKQLAEWITDSRNPLTPRVFVNRLWLHHFGQGLVTTPNNFGQKGALPSHPELLDWLAATFTAPQQNGRGAGGWRIKPMHRLILLSNAYRMASVHPKQASYARKDALNTYLWRFHRRRLDADALRDSMLAVSGELNRTMGGRGFLPSVTREALEGLSRKGAEWNPSPPEEQKRRSVYLFLKRALIPPMMTVFDFGDTTAPLEQRDVTIVAPQALTLMNNPFVTAQSEAFARRIEAEVGKDRAKQVERAWRLAFGRAPSPTERTAAQTHLIETAKRLPPLVRAAPSGAVPGVRLWLRADRGVTASPEGRVARWEDQSGQGFHAAQEQAGAQPSLVPNVLNGQPALRFDGKGKFFLLSHPVLAQQSFSVVAVVKDSTVGIGGHREIFSNWNRERNVGTSVFLGTTGNGQVRLTDHFAPAGTLAKPQNYHLLTAIAGEGGATVYQNREEIARVSSPLPTRNLAPPYVIGQQGNINGEFWNGDMLELIVFDHALTDAERERVWQDLHERYRVAPLPKPADRALASLCHALLNTNEFVYVD